MALELYQFAVTVSAGTAKSSPQKTAMKMPPREVRQIEVLVPPGPRGELGFQLGTGGNQILPVSSGTFVVTDDEKISWTLESQLDSGAWQLIGYNTGNYDHTVYVRFLCDLVGAQPTGGTPLVDGGSLSGGGTSTDGGGLPPAPATPPVPAPPSIPTPTAPLIPVLTPPIQPTLGLPGQGPSPIAYGGRARAVLAMQYASQEHVFWIDQQGALQHAWQAIGAAAGQAAGWTRESWPWAVGLRPAGLLNGDEFGGNANVYSPLAGGGILHAAQSLSGGPASSWGGETIGGAT